MPSTAWFVPSLYGPTLGDLLGDVDGKLDDLTPVMVQISEDMRKFIVDTVFPTGGEGRWAPLAQSTTTRDKWKDRASSGRPGRIGPLRSSGWMSLSVHRASSKTNAAAITKAPHAHLQEFGTKAYMTPLYQSKGKKLKSKSQIKAAKLAGLGGHLRVSPRPFMYIDEDRAENLYPFMILDYVFSEFL
jgi:phage gpG-like protein